MSYDQCPRCKEFGWFSQRGVAQHKCPPIWECRLSWEDEEAWSEVHAVDSESAAEKYAEHYDCEGGDYAIVGGRGKEAIVFVRKLKEADAETDPPYEKWAIEAETVPKYYAVQVT